MRLEQLMNILQGRGDIRAMIYVAVDSDDDALDLLIKLSKAGIYGEKVEERAEHHTDYGKMFVRIPGLSLEMERV